MRFVKLTVVAVLALLLSCFSTLSYAAVPDRITGALTSGETVTLRGNVHHKALPQFDQGPVDPAMRLGTITLLTLPTAGQQRALQQLLVQQQDPKSANYHKWLTPEQFADRFGLSQGDAQQMAAWLKSQGFGMVHVAHGRNWISFNGTAAQVQSAFGTEIHTYNVNGELHYANATPPAIPAAMSGIVTGIRGLHDFRPRPRSIRRNSVARPYYNSSTFGDLIAPGDITTIYGIKALYNAGIDGTGQNIAIMGQTDIYLADITDFRTGFGLSAISCTTNASGVITACNDAHFQYVLDGADPGLSKNGDIGEADLDVEWAGAIAKGAKIIYVNSTDTFTSYYYAIDQKSTLGETVISLSYGLCEFEDNSILTASGQPAADETELMKGNSEGITFLNSSGDSGAAECDPGAPYGTNGAGVDPNGASAQGGFAVSYPASSPEVTGVGGTSISLANLSSGQYWGTSNSADGGTALSYIPEQEWNDDAEFAEYCVQQGSSNQFCTQGGSSPVAGWVPIKTAQNVQTDFSLQGGQGISSAGGGASNCSVQTSNNAACVSGFPQPSWQKVTVSGQTAARFTPDVALLATPNFPGYIFCTQLSELGDSGTGSACAPGGSLGIQNALSGSLNSPSIIGGTSVSTPVFAGIVALLNQSVGSSGLGNINPMLYSLAATPSNGAFHSITSSSGDNNNLVYCTAGTPSVQPAALRCPSSGVLGFQASDADGTTGYNLVTGLGSVDAGKLAAAWAPTTSSGFTLTPSAASFAVSQGASVNATVNVTFNSGFSGTVTFTCSDPAPGSTCNLPSPINASGPVSFNITTTAPTVGSLRPADRGLRIFYAALLPGLLGLVVTAGSRPRSLRGIRFLGLIVVLGFSMLGLASCGGSNSIATGGTTKGTYTITVKGTSGTSTSSATFQLVVQ
jgi:subtilase family serine protease